MSLLILGRTEDLTYEVTENGVRVEGRGKASIGQLTPPGEPPDSTRYDPPIAWTLEPLESDGGLPAHLKHSRLLEGIEEAFERRQDCSLVVLWRSKADHVNTDPPVGCFIIASSELVRRVVELLSLGPVGTQSSYTIDAGGAIVSFYDDAPSGARWVPFNDWMKIGDARFVYGKIAFTIGPSAGPIEKQETIAKRIDMISSQLVRLRRWVIGLAALVALSIAARCAAR